MAFYTNGRKNKYDAITFGLDDGVAPALEGKLVLMVESGTFVDVAADSLQMRRSRESTRRGILVHRHFGEAGLGGGVFSLRHKLTTSGYFTGSSKQYLGCVSNTSMLGAGYLLTCLTDLNEPANRNYGKNLMI